MLETDFTILRDGQEVSLVIQGDIEHHHVGWDRDCYNATGQEDPDELVLYCAKNPETGAKVLLNEQEYQQAYWKLADEAFEVGVLDD